MKTITIPVFSIRRIETPYERRNGYKNYLAVVEARNLPNLEEWREINTRDPKDKGRVPNAIRTSFEEKTDEFLFMNRGLVLAAEKVEFQDLDRGKSIKVTFRDPDLHGLLDGGHTYRVVTEAAKILPDGAAPRFVRVEIITGFDHDTISEVVEARNTSNQVKEESLLEHKHVFDPLKEHLQGHKYYEKIAWSEYEEFPDGTPRPIDVREIISYLVAFDVATYNKVTAQPLIAYKDKRACLKHFEQHQNQLAKLYPLMPRILDLWDEIHFGWREWYNTGRKQDGVAGRFDLLTGVNPKSSDTLHFKDIEIDYRIPDAYKYPILSAFRAAVGVKEDTATWIADPVQLLKENGVALTNVVGHQIRQANNANKVGKDAGLWSSCYLVVQNALQGAVKDRRIEELESKLAAFRRNRK